jgi:hypothetical protein
MNLGPHIDRLAEQISHDVLITPLMLRDDIIKTRIKNAFDSALGEILSLLRDSELKLAKNLDAIDALQARLPVLADQMAEIADLAGKCVDIYTNIITTPISHYDGKPDSFPYAGGITVGIVRRIVELMHRVPGLESETFRAEGGHL